MIDSATILRIICAFAVIAVLLCAFAFVSRRRMGTHLVGGADRLVRVIETTPLAQNAALHVVRIGERYHVVALSSGTISLLTEIDRSAIEGLTAARKSPSAFSLGRRATPAQPAVSIREPQAASGEARQGR